MRRWVRVLVCGAASLAALTVPTDWTSAQRADNGIEESSVNSFEFDPTRGVVRVTIDIDLRNVTTDTVDRDVVLRSFVDAYAVAVPLGAENIVASRNGEDLGGTLISDPEFPAFSTYRFALGAPLFSGEGTRVQVTYDHLGAPPRDPVPWRVNAAYAGFVAFGLGDEGSVTLRISQPFGYEFDEFSDLSGFEVSEPDAFGTVVYTRSGLAEDVRLVVGLSNDERLVSRPLAVDGVDIELRSWPDDPEWAEFAAERVEAGIPALAELIGTPWPVEGSFDVRQTVEPYRAGYAGWFDAQSNEIAVGEALDADTIYHELSHAWINRRLTTERWFTEGLPQVYAAELVRRDGGDARVPSEPTVDDPAAKPLTEWTADDDERPVEEYGYATSFWVLDGLVDEIGLERMRDVVAGLADGSSPYGPTDGVERPERDWQRVYDVLVEVGDSTIAADLFRRFVVDAEDAALIERRDRAAAGVDALAQRSGPWGLPIGVRQRLERWELDDVTSAVAAADWVLAQRAELEAIEQATGIDEPDRAGEAYAVAPMAVSGGVAFAEVESALDAAIELGGELVARLGEITDAAAAAGVAPPDVSELDGVDDFAGGLTAADEQLRALDGIVELEDRLGATGGLLETIGRWGSDLDGALDDARSLVGAGDTEAALDTLAATDRQLDDLARTGALRLGLAAALVALALLALAVFVGRRHRSPASQR